MEIGELKELLRTEYAKNGVGVDNRGLAHLEHELWTFMSAEMKLGKIPRSDLHDWFRKEFDISSYGLMLRVSLRRYPVASAPIWAPLDAGVINFNEARTVLRDALSKHGGDHTLAAAAAQIAIDKLLAEAPPLITASDGARIRSRIAKSVVSRSSGHKPRPKEKTGDTDPCYFIEDYIKSHLGDRVEPNIVKELVTDYVLEWRALFEDMSNRVRRLKSGPNGAAVEIIKWSQLKVAFEALDLSVPRNESDINLQVARKAYRRLAAQYHPDKNQGGGEQQARIAKQYELVTKAWKVISTYAERKNLK